MTLENILADFQLLDDWEDRYRYVIDCPSSDDLRQISV
jgi:sulfur transfer protein SufE